MFNPVHAADTSTQSAVLSRDSAEHASIIWLDIAVILDASSPHPMVETIFDAVANRPLPLPDANRVARRIDLITCAGLKPRHPLYGHGLRLYDSARNLTVADAIAECAQTDPPPELLVLVSDRAPTGEWLKALAAWARQVQRHGVTPTRQHIAWGDHLPDLDGFATAPRELTSHIELRAALAELWRRDMPALLPRRAPTQHRCCPPHRQRAKVLKPFEANDHGGYGGPAF
jgi:hypothetical protein